MNLVIGIVDIPTDIKYVTEKRGSPDPSLFFFLNGSTFDKADSLYLGYSLFTTC